VERGDKNMTFRAIGVYRDLARIRETVVSFAGSDVAVSVDRLGQVVDGEEEKRNHAFYNGKSAIVFIIYKQSGANTVEVVDQVLRQKDVLNEEFKSQPGSPRLNVAMENAWMIRAILGNVEEAIAVAILLTMLVVYLFLGSGISALITLTAIPVSFLGAFATMQYFGFTLNTLTLIALSLAVGLLVDDAIVVRENIWRHMEEGMPPKKAAPPRDAPGGHGGRRHHLRHHRGLPSHRLHEGRGGAVLQGVWLDDGLRGGRLVLGRDDLGAHVCRPTWCPNASRAMRRARATLFWPCSTGSRPGWRTGTSAWCAPASVIACGWSWRRWGSSSPVWG
jgi:hypothetical protein